MIKPPEFNLVKVSADALYRLAPLLATRDECVVTNQAGRYLWGWRVEPCAAGGVLVIATNGKAMGVIHDPEGSARQPWTILASEDLFHAVTPPPPIRRYYPGDWEDVPMPDEFQPDVVIATSLFVSVMDRATGKDDGRPDDGSEPGSLYVETAEDGPIWAGGYRLVADYAPWRRVFEGWKPTPKVDSHRSLSPQHFSRFGLISSNVVEMAYSASDEGPILVQARDNPRFIGAIMPGRMPSEPVPPALPDWMAPAETGS